MQNSAKCPKCDELVANVHYEAHAPNLLSGYRGSQSFTAVAYPCGHALSAVPITWEMRLEELDKNIKEVSQKIDRIYEELANLSAIVRKK